MVCALNVPIRVLGIATSIIWVLLIAVIALSAYSIKDLTIQVDPPSATLGENHQLVLSIPVKVNNTGYTDLKDLNLTTQVFDAKGITLSKSSSYIPIVSKQNNVFLLHNLTLNTDDILQNDSQLLFEDSNLTVTLFGGLNLAGLLPSTISSNLSLPWGAPLYNFSLGNSQFSMFNNTHAIMKTPISFENHASFNVEGNLRVSAYNTDNVLQFEGQTDFSVPANHRFDGNLELYAAISPDTLNVISEGHFEIKLTSTFGNYGPWGVPFG